MLQSDLPRTSPISCLIKLNLTFLHHILDFLILYPQFKIQANPSINSKDITHLKTLQSDSYNRNQIFPRNGIWVEI